MENRDRLLPKPTAILYTNVAGHSRPTGQDEDTTQHKLSEHSGLLAEHTERHGRRVMHYAGDVS